MRGFPRARTCLNDLAEAMKALDGKKSLESTDVRHEGDGYDGCCMWMKTFRHA